MSTLILTPQEDGSVRLDVTALGSAIPSIARFDGNGNASVRTVPGVFPLADGSGAQVLYDWEAALHGPVVYTAGGSTSRTSFVGVLDGPRLVVPLAPAQSLSLAMATGYSAVRDSGSTIHQVPGRVDPIVAVGTMGTRSGTLQLWFPDHASLIDAERIAAAHQVLLLKVPDHASLDLFFAPLRTRPEMDLETGTWTLHVDYVEVKRPTVGINAGSWTVAAAAARYPTITDLRNAYQNVGQMAHDDTAWES